MHFGHEFGECTLFTSGNTTAFLNCKGWCLDDHLIGIETEYNDIDEITLIVLKRQF